MRLRGGIVSLRKGKVCDKEQQKFSSNPGKIVLDRWVFRNLFYLALIGGLIYGGCKGIIQAFDPPTPKQNPDFYRVSVSLNGKETYADMMRPRTAQLLSLIIGVACLLGGILWLLYFLQVWPFHSGSADF